MVYSAWDIYLCASLHVRVRHASSLDNSINETKDLNLVLGW